MMSDFLLNPVHFKAGEKKGSSATSLLPSGPKIDSHWASVDTKEARLLVIAEGSGSSSSPQASIATCLARGATAPLLLLFHGLY